MGISADKLKALRKQKGFSQEELSKVSGIPVMTIRSWEQGSRTPIGSCRSYEKFRDWRL